MTTPAKESSVEPHAELFPHGADVDVRGIGPTPDAAFEQAALALTSVVTDPTRIASKEAVEVTCEAPDDAYLLLDWLNALIYEMAVRRVVFGRFAVSIQGNRLELLQSNRAPSCFRMAPMSGSVASDPPAILPSSRQRSHLLQWSPTRLASPPRKLSR